MSSGLVAAIALTIFAAPASAQPSVGPGPTTGEVQEQPVDQDRVEQIDAERLVLFNDQLAAAGNEQILTGTVALEYRTDGSVVGYLADGTTYERSAAALENNPLLRAGIVEEIKRVVAACLGVSLTATGFWASIEAELTSWDRAAKFLVRRLGVLGAVSCAGGIIWEYI
ncbi:hypothetical protein CH253_15800 [Rhodococcus sp. 06-156-3C]|uniref:hypothetical protein n=1 Tax=Nocardiaceae TaxID=85025 RepID=UPI00052301D8|nr:MULTISPECIES: hypothetical protein [Rhodococcus]OZD19484.1 hypothetical protein CH253_15800 [Rhodococcus sp. 06-156-3C]OZD21648.1 hypothetical protein CH280_01715 [Rhodococcus sp. 06-156-4C]OZD25503.1 hypothetical protein CH248_04585 [Rhodococcus sp. 06-156-4a]OZD33142.1 hypothetical protein CH247_10275 [Rhodococcus sp. 06-156-3b]OZD42044.1 hypothetical protein CH284_00405 [Rhodococcus sp. 06-156-3]